MVKRRKEEETAGVLEFKGMTSEDPHFTAWLAEHKTAKRGKIRIAQGGTGVRVMFSDASDMATWSARAEQDAGQRDGRLLGKTEPAQGKLR